MKIATLPPPLPPPLPPTPPRQKCQVNIQRYFHVLMYLICRPDAAPLSFSLQHLELSAAQAVQRALHDVLAQVQPVRDFTQHEHVLLPTEDHQATCLYQKKRKKIITPPAPPKKNNILLRFRD